ncbi:hypothetical protein VKT23_017646 [Stygiomarasmius scandens]|uniref:F-box domain-containing protein n=1 Tax=Marasmiellus scandens TaxID=2682957 RepID=A0ABR1IU89_9AGAR
MSQYRLRQVLDLISVKERELQSINVDIADVEHGLSTQRYHRSSVSAEVVLFKSLLAPIRKLPPEVLVQIFRSFVYDNVDWRDQNALTAITVSHICSTWQLIALMDPFLWNNIAIHGMWDGEEDDIRVNEMLRVLLFRSGNVPLYITISATDSSADFCPRSVVTITRTSARWRLLRLLDFSDNHWNITPLKDVTSVIPALEILDTTPDTDTMMFRDVQFRPWVTTLRIDIANDSNTSYWPRVTDLQVGTETCDTTLPSVLPVCPWLNRLTLFLGPPQLTYPLASIKTVCELVLVAKDISIYDPNVLFAVANLPSLQKLTLRSTEDLMRFGIVLWWHDSLSQMISRCGCHITSLEVHNLHVFPDSLLQLLFILPDLVSFTFTESLPPKSLVIVNHSVLFQELCVPAFGDGFGTKRHFLRRLRNLSLTLSHNFVGADDLIAMVLSRTVRTAYLHWLGYTHLRCLRLTILGGDIGQYFTDRLHSIIPDEEFVLVVCNM